MNDIKLVIILILCLVILAMLFFNTNEVEKEVVYVQNNPVPLWYYRSGPIWNPPFRYKHRRFR